MNQVHSFDKIKSYLMYAILAMVALALPQFFGNAWVRTFDLAILYIMLALGLNIVIGFAGLLDLGYVAFYAVGAYTVAILGSPHFGIHWPFYVTIPLGALFACIFGLLLGAPVLRLRGDYLAIVTLGFGEIIRICLNNLGQAGANLTNGPQGINLIDPISIFGHPLSKSLKIGTIVIPSVQLYYYFFLFLLVLTIIFVYRIQHSRIGRAWIAIREDYIAASAMGINLMEMKLMAFALGALSGGVAGGLFATLQGFISPESFTLYESMMILAMVVLGGIGHIPGVILGAILLTILPEVLREHLGPMQMATMGKIVVNPENARMLLFGVAMVLMMLIRPAGLWPAKRKKIKLNTESAGGQYD
jgi:branched-chain amino acid transport system permease protein